MRFQLWGNSRCHIQLWEPMPTVHACDRAYRLFAIDIDDQTTIDGVGISYSSQLHDPDHAWNMSIHDIKKSVDEIYNTQPSEPSAA